MCVACDASCETCHQNGLPGDRARCYLCSDKHPYQLVGEPVCLAKCFGANPAEGRDRGYYLSSFTNTTDSTAAEADETDNSVTAASKQTCSRCEAPCRDCEGGKDQCTACEATSALPVLFFDTDENGENLNTGKCIAECPIGYTDVAGACRKCQSPCETCVNTTTTCLSCDGTNDTRFVFSNVCHAACPAGTTPDNTHPENPECIGCRAGCDLCDDRRPDVCLVCGMSQESHNATTGTTTPAQQLFVFNGTCEPGCPEAWRLNGDRTACVPVTINDLEKIYFPFLCCAAVAWLIVFFGMCKKKPGRTKYISTQNTLTCLITATAPI